MRAWWDYFSNNPFGTWAGFYEQYYGWNPVVYNVISGIFAVGVIITTIWLYKKYKI